MSVKQILMSEERETKLRQEEFTQLLEDYQESKKQARNTIIHARSLVS